MRNREAAAGRRLVETHRRDIQLRPIQWVRACRRRPQ